MLRLQLIALILFAAAGLDATIVDRVAVVVGRRAIKTSDISEEMRVTGFLNREQISGTPTAKRKAAERLIDQELVRQDLADGQYSQPTEKDVNALLDQFKRDRFSGSDARFRAALQQYQLTEEQLRQHLLWQLSVLRFIDQRFRSGVLVTGEDIAAYYHEHRAALVKAYPRNNSQQALEPAIREILTGQRVNQAFEAWVAETRKSVRIEFREKAFSGGTSP